MKIRFGGSRSALDRRMLAGGAAFRRRPGTTVDSGLSPSFIAGLRTKGRHQGPPRADPRGNRKLTIRRQRTVGGRSAGKATHAFAELGPTTYDGRGGTGQGRQSPGDVGRDLGGGRTKDRDQRGDVALLRDSRRPFYSFKNHGAPDEARGAQMTLRHAQRRRRTAGKDPSLDLEPGPRASARRTKKDLALFQRRGAGAHAWSPTIDRHPPQTWFDLTEGHWARRSCTRPCLGTSIVAARAADRGSVAENPGGAGAVSTACHRPRMRWTSAWIDTPPRPGPRRAGRLADHYRAVRPARVLLSRRGRRGRDGARGGEG